ncbi:MAG: peptide-methionine (S)-S-oxide reductase MsrA [Psittacicella sp.]
MSTIKEVKLQTLTLAGGCFWCLEAIFLKLKGIYNVYPGYSGGIIPNPSYEEVCTGNTHHAEVINFDYDPKIITLKDIYKIFFTIHNPTTLNQQGEDKGTQYRSAIFYRNEEQKDLALEAIKALESSKIWKNIVTEVKPFEVFYKAEDYHLNYFANNPQNQYCALVINPKLSKFKDYYTRFLK